MLPLAVALTLAATPPPEPPPMPAMPRVVVLPQARACGPDIDPYFVHYVAPPRRSSLNPLLWWIGGEAPTPLAAGKAAKPEVWVLAPKAESCLRPLQTAY